jgi:hypothetical protein
MPLVTRKPRKLIRASLVAERWGCSTDTVIRMAKENGLQLVPLNPGKKTTPWMLYERAVEAFESHREQIAEEKAKQWGI